jgi:hypothetical protein
LSDAPLRFDFYVDEGRSGYQFQFRTPKEVIDHELATSTAFAKNYSEVTMTWWNPTVRQFQATNRRVPALTAIDQPVLWSGLFDFEYGDARLRPSLDQQLPSGGEPGRPLATAGTKDGLIANWASRVPESPLDPFQQLKSKPYTVPELVDSFHTVRIARGHEQEVATPLELPSESTALPLIAPIPDTVDQQEQKEPVAMPHIVKKRAKQLDAAEPQSDPWFHQKLVDATTETGLCQTIDPATRTRWVPLQPQAACTAPGTSDDDYSARSYHHEPQQQPSRSYAKILSEKGSHTRDVSTTDSTLSRMEFPLLGEEHRCPHPLGQSLSTLPPGYNGAASSPWGRPQSLRSTAMRDVENQTHTVRVPTECPPTDEIDRAPSLEAPLDILAMDDEESTRLMRHAPSLLAVRKPPKAKVENDHTKVLMPAIEQFLGLARARYNSSVVLEAKLGRIFIESATAPKEWRHTRAKVAPAFEAANWSRVFHTHKNVGNASTVFSSKITGSWIDAEYLIELQDDEQNLLFQPPGHSDYGRPDQKSTVEIVCRDTQTGERVLITVEEGQAAKMNIMPSLLGSVNMHFPDRRWDASFRMSATGDLSPELAAKFQSIATNLWIRGPASTDHTGPLPRPFLASNKGKHVAVDSIMLKREVECYSMPAFAEDIAMVLTQVQRLHIEEQKNGAFRAYLTAKEADKTTQYRWWEMSLRPRQLNLMFDAENPSLAIGDLAQYESWEQHKGEVVKMMKMVREVVPRVDIVGQPVAVPQASGLAPSEVTGRVLSTFESGRSGSTQVKRL